MTRTFTLGLGLVLLMPQGVLALRSREPKCQILYSCNVPFMSEYSCVISYRVLLRIQANAQQQIHQASI